MNKRKSLGQNFLVDKTAVKKFLQNSDLHKKDNVLEIGVGEGALTLPIANSVNTITSIEIDYKLAAKMAGLGIENLQIVNEDFLRINLKDLIQEREINKIVASIPYGITSPIIHKIIRESVAPLEEVHLITQKEFADKLIGGENKKSYFTFLIENWGNITEGNKIRKESFNPIPKVDSKSFSIVLHDYPNNEKEVVKWSKFVHFAFASPRKKINKRFSKEQLKKLNISEDKRPENLTLSEMRILYKDSAKIA